MWKTAEPKRAVIADESVLVIRPPRGLFEPVVRIGIEPTAWNPVLVGAARPGHFRPPFPQGRAGALVWVDSEDPVARALSVQQSYMPLCLLESDAENAVGGCGVLLEPIPIGARIGGDHDL